MSRVDIGLRLDLEPVNNAIARECTLPLGGKLKITRFPEFDPEWQAEYGIELTRHTGEVLNFGISEACLEALSVGYWLFQEDKENEVRSDNQG